MIVKVLGAGCAKCKQLFAQVEKAVAASGRSAQLEKVERLEQIVRYGVLVTPALVIDEEVKCTGRLPSASELQNWLGGPTVTSA